MQTTKKLSIMMGAVTILFGTFFIVFSVIAASNTFKIISAEITEKSASAQATIVDFDDTVINNNVEFYALDDYVIYTIGLKNTGTSDARITSLTVNNNNPHIIYDYASSYDTTLGPNEVFSFDLKAIYSSYFTILRDRRWQNRYRRSNYCPKHWRSRILWQQN